MKKYAVLPVMLSIIILTAVLLSGCGESEKTQEELAVGNWAQLKNRAYILLITTPKGGWSSSVRITDATSKVVKSKGNATGTWHIEKNQMIFTVNESDIEEIWETNATLFFDISLLTDTEMHLKDESGYTTIWKQTKGSSQAQVEEALNQEIPLGPVAVNLNKNRSNDKDRYLCLNLNMVIKELMPDEEIPPIHPRAREAAMLFLSSLVFNDVKDFDRLKIQAKRLLDVINPYMHGVVKEIVIEHVIVATEIEKVEEFLIEHTASQTPDPAQEGEEGEGGEEKSEEG